MKEKKKITYIFDNDLSKYYYGAGHPMKPWRLRLTHELILSYGMYRKMEIWKPRDISEEEICVFHDVNYIRFLKEIKPNNERKLKNKKNIYSVGKQSDCPIFDQMFDFNCKCTAGSIDGAIKLNHKDSDICINWSGGLHHAKKCEASGFCYINDIVLAIIELLKFHDRVLYIDIDVHHGDGVEEAFYSSNRVLTVSFHRYGDFFPGSGDTSQIGVHDGRYRTINVPLSSGINDNEYETLFKPIIRAVIERYQPNVVVLQCGADSLAHDRLGCFNLTLHGHGMCIDFIKSFHLPLLLLGGGGYNIRNVARCWAYETSLILDMELKNDIPYNDFISYFGPSFNLHIDPSLKIKNENNPKHLRSLKSRILKNIERIEIAPSIQIQERLNDTYLNMTEKNSEKQENTELDTAGDDRVHKIPDNEF